MFYPTRINCYVDETHKAIRVKYGMEAYGIIRCLLDALAATYEHKMKWESLEVFCIDLHYADPAGEKLNTLTQIIKKYFSYDEDYFWFEELNENLSYYDNKYNKASLGGRISSEMLTPEERSEKAKKAAEVRWGLNEMEMLTDAKGLASDANNKRKEKKIEINKIKEDKIEENETEDFLNPSSEEPIEGSSAEDFSLNDLEVVGNYFNSKGIQTIEKLYNTTPTIKNIYSFTQFEEIILLSQVMKLLELDEKGSIDFFPTNNAKLQYFNYLIDTRNFEDAEKLYLSENKNRIELKQDFLNQFRKR